jgi:hypothetical protein
VTDWIDSDLGPFDPADTDRAKIGRKIWVPCRIYYSLFERMRFTALYCYQCHMGFCEGEHGQFDETRGHRYCVLHHSKNPFGRN